MSVMILLAASVTAASADRAVAGPRLLAVSFGVVV